MGHRLRRRLQRAIPASRDPTAGRRVVSISYTAPSLRAGTRSSDVPRLPLPCRAIPAKQGPDGLVTEKGQGLVRAIPALQGPDLGRPELGATGLASSLQAGTQQIRISSARLHQRAIPARRDTTWADGPIPSPASAPSLLCRDPTSGRGRLLRQRPRHPCKQGCDLL